MGFDWHAPQAVPSIITALCMVPALGADAVRTLGGMHDGVVFL